MRKKSNVKAEQTVEEFMLSHLSDDSDLDERIHDTEPKPRRKSLKSKKFKGKESDELQNAKSHKKSLKGLKRSDPEFYDFLKSNDAELLNFAASEDESDGGGSMHIPPDKLEVDSDQSDGESSEAASNFLTLAVIDGWNINIDKKENVTAVVHEIVQAFKAAVNEALGSNEKNVKTKYIVKGSSVFNAVCRICVLKLPQAIRVALAIKEDDRNPNVQKCKRWKKIRIYLKSYITDLMKLLSSMNDPSLLSVMLKHVHSLLKYVSCLDKIVNALLKVLVNLWSTADETVRVLSFMCILKLTRLDQSNRLEWILKLMYLTYVKNVKFTSANTWPAINFLRKSLVEMFGLDPRLSYQHAFMYIRQLAIHLRTALTINKKENIQAVCNWQYLHCLYLWGDLLGTFNDSTALSPLVYPLVQITMGVIRLVPNMVYIPLRFHCVRMLTKLSHQCNTFIPVLPFIYETLELVNLNKRHSINSIKPLEFRCLVRLSNQQLQESALKDGFINEVYELLMDYLSGLAHSIGFPELVLPLVVKIKAFLKACKSPNHCKKMKQLLDKIQDNSKFISERRLGVNFALGEDSEVTNWQNKCLQASPPLIAYYSSWRQVRDKELILGSHRKTEVLELPTIQRQKFLKKTVASQELFPSDEEEEPTLLEKESEHEVQSKQTTKKRKKVNPPVKPIKKQKITASSFSNDEKDLVEDFQLSEDESSCLSD